MPLILWRFWKMNWFSIGRGKMTARQSQHLTRMQMSLRPCPIKCTMTDNAAGHNYTYIYECYVLRHNMHAQKSQTCMLLTIRIDSRGLNDCPSNSYPADLQGLNVGGILTAMPWAPSHEHGLPGNK